MWGIFLESVVIFKNYMGYHENHFLAGIYLLALLYLWLTEKDRRRRVVFVYAPTLILFLFFCPLFRKVFVRLMEDSETYYRLLWLLQMSIVSAYGLIRLMGRHRRIGLAAACLAVVACGDYVYDSEHISWGAERLPPAAGGDRYCGYDRAGDGADHSACARGSDLLCEAVQYGY